MFTFQLFKDTTLTTFSFEEYLPEINNVDKEAEKDCAELGRACCISCVCGALFNWISLNVFIDTLYTFIQARGVNVLVKKCCCIITKSTSDFIWFTYDSQILAF